MKAVNGKAIIKVGNKYIMPGEKLEAPPELIKRLEAVGLVTATAEPKEKATKPNAKKRKKASDKDEG